MLLPQLRAQREQEAGAATAAWITWLVTAAGGLRQIAASLSESFKFK